MLQAVPALETLRMLEALANPICHNPLKQIFLLTGQDSHQQDPIKGFCLCLQLFSWLASVHRCSRLPLVSAAWANCYRSLKCSMCLGGSKPKKLHHREATEIEKWYKNRVHERFCSRMPHVSRFCVDLCQVLVSTTGTATPFSPILRHPKDNQLFSELRALQATGFGPFCKIQDQSIFESSII